MLQGKIDLVTAEQNVFEWFVSRMFCRTASPAQKYISLGLKKEDFKAKDHWEKIESYIQREEIVRSHVDTTIHDLNEVEKWAKDMFVDNIDALPWMSNIDNLAQLYRDSLHNAEEKRKWVALCKEFKIFVYGKKDGFTNVTPETIHNWAIMNDNQKSIARYVTIDGKKKELKRRLPNSHPSYSNIKNMTGKSYLS